MPIKLVNTINYMLYRGNKFGTLARVNLHCVLVKFLPNPDWQCLVLQIVDQGPKQTS